jgi:hypothetical protein
MTVYVCSNGHGHYSSTPKMQTARIPARTPLWLCWQPPFAANAQKLQINFAFHPAKAGKAALLGEMQSLFFHVETIISYAF